jgi:hypothetical protein
MSIFTDQKRRLRHIYALLNSIEKAGVTPDITIHNLLLDIRTTVEFLIKKARPV